ncbi:MAG: hypothetical protein PHE86_03285 [Candidatus Marinimicrobia bacterium]|nr:hypothetical protein [Candidatus Neomarinimicrobiota bacterium]MDD5582276.1 hypothetical protein [Candidatus Neomarinimicrobiota bacterium]
MYSPILSKCPFCGGSIQQFIGHVSGNYAFFCTQSKKLIILDNDLHSILFEHNLNKLAKMNLCEYIHHHKDFEIYLTLETVDKITTFSLQEKME